MKRSLIQNILYTIFTLKHVAFFPVKKEKENILPNTNCFAFSRPNMIFVVNSRVLRKVDRRSFRGAKQFLPSAQQELGHKSSV